MQFDSNNAHIHPLFLQSLEISIEGRGEQAILNDLTKRLNQIVVTRLRHQPFAYRYDADDIAQQTCLRLRAITEAHSFDPLKCHSPKNFIKGIINNVILEQTRSLTRRDSREHWYVELKPIKPDDPAELAEREECLRLVREAYLKLTASQQAIVRRVYSFLDPSSPKPDTRRYRPRQSHEALANEQIKKMFDLNMNSEKPPARKPLDEPK